MQYSDIKLKTLELVGDIAEGSSAYSPELVAKAAQWSQEQACQLLGLSYIEGITGLTGVTYAAGETGVGVLVPADAIKVTRIQLWDSSMIDLVGG
jgi:hypothetical protein